jgi:hypothetical protein
VTHALAGVKRYIGALALAFTLLALSAAIAKYSQSTSGSSSAGDGIDFSHELFWAYGFDKSPTPGDRSSLGEP